VKMIQAREQKPASGEPVLQNVQPDTASGSSLLSCGSEEHSPCQGASVSIAPALWGQSHLDSVHPQLARDGGGHADGVVILGGHLR
jgi:hypothetical protein